MKLQAFLEAGLRNHWLKYPHMNVYVRRGFHMIGGEIQNTLDIANIEVAQKYQKQGIFTTFLSTAEQLADEQDLVVHVESILNTDLYRFLLKRGYQEIERNESSLYRLKGTA